MLKEKKIVASIIANSQEELEKRLNKINKDVDTIQLDIMDGKFVPEKSLFFNFIFPKTDKKVEAHLMIEDPEEWIVEVGSRVDTIIFHYESTKNVEKTINLIQKMGKKVALAIGPKTKVFEIKKFLPVLDQVLVFTANQMGQYGAKLSQAALEKVNILAKSTDILIEVDGGINKQTINDVSKKGANLFVCGSVLQKSEDVEETVKELKELF